MKKEIPKINSLAVGMLIKIKQTVLQDEEMKYADLCGCGKFTIASHIDDIIRVMMQLKTLSHELMCYNEIQRDEIARYEKLLCVDDFDELTDADQDAIGALGNKLRAVRDAAGDEVE